MKKSTNKTIILSKVHIGTSPVITMELFFFYFETDFPEPKNILISKIWLLFILHGIWQKCSIYIWKIFLFFPSSFCLLVQKHSTLRTHISFFFLVLCGTVLSYFITVVFVSKFQDCFLCEIFSLPAAAGLTSGSWIKSPCCRYVFSILSYKRCHRLWDSYHLFRIWGKFW